MDKVIVIAKTTLKEMIRDKIFYVAIIIAVMLFSLSFLLGALSFSEQRKILADFGFLGIDFALLGVSLFSGSFMLAKEIEKQTCLLILSRPVSRDQFILGKIFGVSILNLILTGILGFILWLLLGLWNDVDQTIRFVEICISLVIQSIIILSAVMYLSVVVRPILALSSGMAMYLLGQWLPDLLFFAEKSKDQFFISAVKTMHWVVPNFYKMNWKSNYYLEKGISNQNFYWMLLHMLAWFLIFQLLTNYSFRRKDIV